MAIRWWAGARYHYKHGTLWSKLGFSEHLYAASGLFSLFCYYLTSHGTLTFDYAFIFNAIFWIIAIIASWNLYFDDCEKNGS
jgi:hypothetical protein